MGMGIGQGAEAVSEIRPLPPGMTILPQGPAEGGPFLTNNGWVART